MTFKGSQTNYKITGTIVLFSILSSFFFKTYLWITYSICHKMLCTLYRPERPYSDFRTRYAISGQSGQIPDGWQPHRYEEELQYIHHKTYQNLNLMSSKDDRDEIVFFFSIIFQYYDNVMQKLYFLMRYLPICYRIHRASYLKYSVALTPLDPVLQKVGGQPTPLTPWFRRHCQLRYKHPVAVFQIVQILYCIVLYIQILYCNCIPIVQIFQIVFCRDELRLLMY